MRDGPAEEDCVVQTVKSNLDRTGLLKFLNDSKGLVFGDGGHSRAKMSRDVSSNINVIGL